MRSIKITDSYFIYNDMPRGWVRGKTQPKWHKSLYDRWRLMFLRCKNPQNTLYKWYKDCKIDERYRYLSNYVNDIMLLENFENFCENPHDWEIDKDKKDPNNRHYSFEHLNIITIEDNRLESLNRNGNPMKDPDIAKRAGEKSANSRRKYK